jgi:hypothetical protein
VHYLPCVQQIGVNLNQFCLERVDLFTKLLAPACKQHRFSFSPLKAIARLDFCSPHSFPLCNHPLPLSLQLFRKALTRTLPPFLPMQVPFCREQLTPQVLPKLRLPLEYGDHRGTIDLDLFGLRAQHAPPRVCVAKSMLHERLFPLQPCNLSLAPFQA